MYGGRSWGPRASSCGTDAGLVELVSLCGYCTLISFLLNAFAVPLPPGARADVGRS
jgi:hypothetical protein